MQRAQERRAGPRASFGGTAHVRADDFDIVCQSVNLSSDGILLLSPVRAQPGLSMRLNVFLSALNKWGETEAVLMRQQQHEGQLAWGLRFRDTTPFMGTVFRTFVRRTLRGDYAAGGEAATSDAMPRPRRATANAGAPGVRTGTKVSQQRDPTITPSQPQPIDLTPSESGLRTLYRDAVADLSSADGSDNANRPKRGFWSRLKKQ